MVVRYLSSFIKIYNSGGSGRSAQISPEQKSDNLMDSQVKGEKGSQVGRPAVD